MANLPHVLYCEQSHYFIVMLQKPALGKFAIEI